ncbi:molybdopterin-dependent oxidoreductase [Vibrio sp. S17_S38]|uniref:nitrate reductase n=1 Tax=Vibrio sp. S17_S38 TaxID=2720229 RepID=UPI001680DBBA|nr:nitrate reductase [Vibrio sp. S17_S38]MBD1574127.1 molybdopterin-dependent oxidoreductase [Vibrio sp. S17_S38]
MTKQCIQSACPYCGVGCGVSIQKDGAIVGDRNHPANQGALCVKGSALAESLNMPSRLLYPRVHGEQASWEHTIEMISSTMHRIAQESGPESIGMYVSGQLLTEDYYVANKLMKGFIGSSNIDTNSRLCMSSAVAAHVRSFGEDLVPVSYDDLSKTDLIVIVGANTAWTHPIVFRRIQQARETNPNLKLVVIDPRKTVTAEQADLHLAVANDGDVLLFNGLLRYLLDNQTTENQTIDFSFVDQFTQGVDDIIEEVKSEQYQLRHVSQSLNIDLNILASFYQWFAATPTAVTLFCQGVNQSESGTDKANAIINAHLLTGKIGKAGCGPFSITGQPNAMGGREVGGLANQLAIHRGFDDESIKQVEAFWQAPNIAKKAGLKSVDLFDAIEQGKVRFIWIMATNPVVSLPDSDKIRRALEKCECVVVSDITANADIAQYADILLPAAGWGEKQGMVTNSERCLTRQRQFIQPPGEAKPDWWMVTEVGKKICELMEVDSGFEFASEADVFREYAAMTGLNQHTPLQLDISALSTLTDPEYQSWLPQRWPLPKIITLKSESNKNDPKNIDVLRHKTDVFRNKSNEGIAFPTDSGKANFVLTKPNFHRALDKGRYWLNTGRQRDQWHTMTRTGHIAHLSATEVEPTIYMNSLDAEQAKLKIGYLVCVHQGGNDNKKSVTAKLSIDDNLTHSQVFMSMHWAGEYGKTSQVNAAMQRIVDPHSGQPAFKSQIVDITAMEVASYGISVGINLTLNRWDYLSLQHVNYQDKAITSSYQKGIWRFAHRATITKLEIQAQIKKEHPRCKFLSLDHEKGWGMVALVNDTIVCVVSISDQPVALSSESLIPLINQKLKLTQVLSALSSSQDQQSTLICSCFRVTELDILQVLETRPSVSLSDLQSALKCGTNCGSCLPEVNRYLKSKTIDVMTVK